MSKHWVETVGKIFGNHLLPDAPRQFVGESVAPRSPRRRQAGMAVGELIVLTIPLAVLSMAVASKLTATSSARLEGQWRVALKAQLATRKPCSLSDTDALMTAPAALIMLNGKVRKAWEPLAVTLIPTPDELVAVTKKKEELTTPVPKYFYQTLADRSVADGLSEVKTSATFVCNEPENAEVRRGIYEAGLLVIGHLQAAKLFGTIGGGDSGGETPEPPEACPKGESSEDGIPCDVIE